MQREVILDTETTGLDTRSGHRLIEVGCVELVNRFPSGRVYHALIDPERDVPAEAFAIHGIGTETLRGKPKFADVAVALLDFIGEATLVIHNASFDLGFVNFELDRAGHGLIPMERVVDTLLLARRKHPAGPNSLDALCKRYQIDISARTKHGALLDAELLAKVYLELVGGHQARLGLDADQETSSSARGTRRNKARTRPTPLPSRLTEAEIAAHKAFVGDLGKEPLWFKDAEFAAAKER